MLFVYGLALTMPTSKQIGGKWLRAKMAGVFTEYQRNDEMDIIENVSIDETVSGYVSLSGGVMPSFFTFRQRVLRLMPSAFAVFSRLFAYCSRKVRILSASFCSCSDSRG